MSKNIISDIYNQINSFIESKENEEYQKLSMIKKILISTSERNKVKDFLRYESIALVDKVINPTQLEYWKNILSQYEPESLYKKINKVMESIKAKNEPKNEWLNQKLSKISLDEKLKDISVDKVNLEILIRYAGLIYCMNRTNAKLTGYNNTEVKDLYHVIMNIPCFERFIELSGGLTTFLENGGELLSDNKSLLEEKKKKFLEEINNSHYQNIEIRSLYTSIPTDEIRKIIKKNIEGLFDNDLFNYVKDIQVEIGQSTNMILEYYLKLIVKHNNEADKIIKYLEDFLVSKSYRGVDDRIRDIQSFLGKIYNSMSFEEYKNMFYETAIDDKKEGFLLISKVINNDNYKLKLLKELAPQDLEVFAEYLKKNIDGRRTLEAHKFLRNEVLELSRIARNILEDRLSEKEIKKFKNGENTIDLKMMNVKMISVEFSKLNLLFRNKINSSSMNKTTEDYVLTMSDDRANLFLIGDYANHLTEEEATEILIEVIHEKIDTNIEKVDAAALIRSKKLKYTLNKVGENKEKNIQKKKV